MGRRGKGHSYVKYILLLDKNGKIWQRHELDGHGKLKYPLEKPTPLQNLTPAVEPQLQMQMQMQPLITSDSSNNIQFPKQKQKKMDKETLMPFNIPMPPMLRSKMEVSSLFDFKYFLQKTIPQTIDVPNIVDVRPPMMVSMQMK